MSRKFLSLGVLAAAFTLVLGTTDAQACRRQRSCCQNSNFAYNNCGHQQVANYGCQQTANVSYQQASYVAVNTCCAPRATCCNTRPACTTSVIPANFSAPVPQPPVEQAAPAPAPGS